MPFHEKDFNTHHMRPDICPLIGSRNGEWNIQVSLRQKLGHKRALFKMFRPEVFDKASLG